MKPRMRSILSGWGLLLLIFALVLQISGLELALHEAAEKDCSDGADGVCLLCVSLGAAPASLVSAPVLPPAPAPVHVAPAPDKQDPVPHYGTACVPGRSPPLVLPA